MRPSLHVAAPVAAPVAALIVAIFALVAPAWAGSLGIAPLRVELTPEQRSASLTLQNNGEEEALVQVEAMAWARSGEPLVPTRELIALPTVVRIAPAERQLVRVALRNPFAGRGEAAYRLLVSEVPPELPGGGAGVKIALRFSLPVFVTPPGALPSPSWRLLPGAGGLELANRGSAHLHVTRISLFAQGAAAPAGLIQEGAYVLPGEAHAWPLPPGLRGPLRLKADTDRGELEAVVAGAGG